MTVKSLEVNITSQDQDMGQEPATQTEDAPQGADASGAGVSSVPEKAAGVEGGDKVLRIQCSSAQVSQMEKRLQWAADYLCPTHAGDARILNLWLRCKVYRLSFEAGLAAQGWPLSRRHADRVKDRALSRIAQALQDRGTPK